MTLAAGDGFCLSHLMARRKLIAENPFAGVSLPATGIADRQRFVTRAETERVLAECPDHNWRAIVALSRYGGLRSPSETLSVKWTDINWETGRMVVTSPKTEHHPGRGSRVVPLFPELRAILADVFEQAEEGAVYVVDEKYRKRAMGPNAWLNANLRTTFEKIVKRAGLVPWPRLFHNLRASRETELVESYPVQVVTSWLGNTPAVAMRHYLMTTEQHFATAIAGDKNAAQNPAQSVHEMGCNGPQAVTAAQEKPPVFPGSATVCEVLQKSEIAGAIDRGGAFRLWPLLLARSGGSFR